ncbi:acyltransferase family protein [Dactylosporangium sp. CA-139114]|uniref:acyltransferase family protein n=1 Tax=Dactylosporangium sp. CA-139114 TaxID=3239931 RepID=UPI003D95405C
MTLPAGRDRYLDVLRAVAIARVVVFHMFSVVWLSWAFPAMGLMFALGGSLMAASLQRSAVRAVTGRVRRLLPALWVLAAVVVPVMLWHGWTTADPNGRDLRLLVFWLVPLADPPGSAWAGDATVVLWYLVTYLWLVLLSPLAWRLFRRLPVVATVLPLAVLAATQLAPGHAGLDLLGWRAGAVVVDVATFGSCWMAGFAHRTGALRRLHPAALAALAGGCITAGAAWAFTHPPEDGAGNLNDIPLAQGLYSLGFAILLLRAAPAMRWLRRVPLLDRAVTLLNARAVTIYLWHNIAIALCFWVGDRLHVWQLGPATEPGYFAVALVLLCVPVLVLGPVEDLAARRRPALLPAQRTAAAADRAPAHVPAHAAAPGREAMARRPSVPTGPPGVGDNRPRRC